MIKWKIALTGAGIAALMSLGSLSFAQAPAAQQPGQPGQARQRRQVRQRPVQLATLPVATLDKLLSLTPDQKTKVTAIHDKLLSDLKAATPPATAQPAQPGQRGQRPDPAVRQKRMELTTAANKEIEALLTDEQKKKLPDVGEEVSAVTSTGAPQGMVGELKLTPDQKKKIAEIQKEMRDKRTALSSLTPEERRAKGAELRQERQTKIDALLTPDQKASIEKYNKEHPRPAGNNRNPNRP